MFWSKNEKPQFYNINVGFKGVYITQTCFRDAKCRRRKVSLHSLSRLFQHLNGNITFRSTRFIFMTENFKCFKINVSLGEN